MQIILFFAEQWYMALMLLEYPGVGYQEGSDLIITEENMFPLQRIGESQEVRLIGNEVLQLFFVYPLDS